ncbi:MAG: hypothetical protein GY953_21905, partial [bacterium]|nr:hypothetical protein [bacterium]
MRRLLILVPILALAAIAQELPQSIDGGYLLPNGWRITPVGKAIQTDDMVLNVTVAPDGRAAIAMHSGFNPHGLVVIDAASGEAVQRILLKSA